MFLLSIRHVKIIKIVIVGNRKIDPSLRMQRYVSSKHQHFFSNTNSIDRVSLRSKLQKIRCHFRDLRNRNIIRQFRDSGLEFATNLGEIAFDSFNQGLVRDFRIVSIANLRLLVRFIELLALIANLSLMFLRLRGRS